MQRVRLSCKHEFALPLGTIISKHGTNLSTQAGGDLANEFAADQSNPDFSRRVTEARRSPS